MTGPMGINGRTFAEVTESLKAQVRAKRHTADQTARHLHDAATACGLNLTLEGCRVMVQPGHLPTEGGAVSDDGHVLLVHPRGHHDREDGARHCMFCDGGLSACTTCGAFEGAWPDQCPGEQMTRFQSDSVYAGSLNYRDGAWRAETCRIRRPAEDVLIEDGYRCDDNGKWIKP